MRIAGIALGRFTMVDRRPPDTAQDAAQMIAAFIPGTVAVLSRHTSLGGVVIGNLETLEADGPDLRFTGSLVEYPDLVDRLWREGAVSISIETVWGAEPLPAGVRDPDPSEPLSVTRPHFRGTLRFGMNLVGVALSENPAARGSVAWIVSDR